MAITSATTTGPCKITGHNTSTPKVLTFFKVNIFLRPEEALLMYSKSLSTANSISVFEKTMEPSSTATLKKIRMRSLHLYVNYLRLSTWHFMNNSTLYRYACVCYFKSFLACLRKKKYDKKSVSGHRFERTDVVAKCEIFMNCSETFIGMCTFHYIKNYYEAKCQIPMNCSKIFIGATLLALNVITLM